MIYEGLFLFCFKWSNYWFKYCFYKSNSFIIGFIMAFGPFIYAEAMRGLDPNEVVKE